MNDVIDTQVLEIDKANNLKAIFEILAYLQVDAKKDGMIELSDRLEFAMNLAEQKLTELKAQNSELASI